MISMAMATVMMMKISNNADTNQNIHSDNNSDNSHENNDDENKKNNNKIFKMIQNFDN